MESKNDEIETQVVHFDKRVGSLEWDGLLKQPGVDRKPQKKNFKGLPLDNWLRGNYNNYIP